MKKQILTAISALFLCLGFVGNAMAGDGRCYSNSDCGGGVACNSALRAAMLTLGEENGKKVYYPDPILCTDNAAMIGSAAYYEFLSGHTADWTLNAVPNLKLGEKI